jgi:ligand-binding sensor domain-containing protein
LYAVDHITFITEDSIGRVWIGTFENGLNVYDPETQKVAHYGANTASITGLRKDELWCAYKTRDGVLWISSMTDPDGVVDLYKVSMSQ